MAKRVKQSVLRAKMEQGQRAFSHLKDAPVNYGVGTDLPAGVIGVAQLTECKFDVYKNGEFVGEPYFYASGVVVSPEEFQGVRIAGAITQIGPEPLCDTPNRSRKTIDDHLAWVINEMKKLGVDTTQMSDEDWATELEVAAEELKEQQPYFRFRTWQSRPTEQFPDPRVLHQWRGICEYEAKEAEPEVADNTEEEPNYSVLTALADKGDEEAIAKLESLAEKAGIPLREIEELQTWAEAALKIKRAIEGNVEEVKEEEVEVVEETEEAEEVEEDESFEQEQDDSGWVPEKGEVYLYKEPGSKRKKGVEVEVLTVFESKRTCNVKALDTGQLFKQVSWDHLN